MHSIPVGPLPQPSLLFAENILRIEKLCELVLGQGHMEEPEPRYYICRLPHLSTRKSNGINEEKQANIPLKECLPVFAITMSA